MLLLLTRDQLVARIQQLNFLRLIGQCDRSTTLENVPGQTFYILRVEQQLEQHYVEMLSIHPIGRMPEWGVVDFLVNAEME